MKRIRGIRAMWMMETLESRVMLSAASAAAGLRGQGLAQKLPVFWGGQDVRVTNGQGAVGVGARAGASGAPGKGASGPANVSAKALGPKAVYLSWSASDGNISGYHVYRTVNGNTTQIDVPDAGARTYADVDVAAGSSYTYRVAAYGPGWVSGMSASVNVSTPKDVRISPGATPGIFSRYGGELVIAGTTGNDAVVVTQSGKTLAVALNGGAARTFALPANGLFIYSFGGVDTITVDSSVTLHITIAAIDGAATTIKNSAANASIWMDATDAFTGLGSVHAVDGFYGGVSKDVAVNVAEPLDAGGTFRPSSSLWGAGPVMEDVKQGGIGDCYFLSSLAAFANSCPARLREMAVDLGDGTYVVEYLRGGTETYVRVDGEISLGAYGGYAFAHPGDTGDLWAMIMEKSYAYFRAGFYTYGSLTGGWMSNVYSDFGVANADMTIGAEAAFYNAVSGALAGGKPVTFATFGAGTTLVPYHSYSLVSAYTTGKTKYYQVRNPWGVAGDSLENAGGYAVLTYKQVVANFWVCTAGV